MRVMWSQRDPTLRRSNVGNIFIKNLQPEVTCLELKSLLLPYGNILSCKLASDEDGASRGYGFAHYENAADAELAIADLNGKEYRGKVLFVGMFQSKRERESQGQANRMCNLYVKNFDAQTTDEVLRRLFEQYGPVQSATVIRNQDGTSRGFGFVSMKEEEHSALAVQHLHGMELENGKLLYVNYFQKREDRAEEIRKKFEGLVASQTEAGPNGADDGGNAPYDPQWLELDVGEIKAAASTQPNLPDAVAAKLPAAVPPNLMDAMPPNMPAAVPPNLMDAMPPNMPADVPPNLMDAMPAAVPPNRMDAMPPNIPAAVPPTLPAAIPKLMDAVLPNMPSAVPANMPAAAPPNLMDVILPNMPAAVPATIPAAVPPNMPAAVPPNWAPAEGMTRKYAEVLMGSVCEDKISENKGLPVYAPKDNPWLNNLAADEASYSGSAGSSYDSTVSDTDMARQFKEIVVRQTHSDPTTNVDAGVYIPRDQQMVDDRAGRGDKGSPSSGYDSSGSGSEKSASVDDFRRQLTVPELPTRSKGTRLGKKASEDLLLLLPRFTESELQAAETAEQCARLAVDVASELSVGPQDDVYPCPPLPGGAAFPSPPIPGDGKAAGVDGFNTSGAGNYAAAPRAYPPAQNANELLAASMRGFSGGVFGASNPADTGGMPSYCKPGMTSSQRDLAANIMGYRTTDPRCWQEICCPGNNYPPFEVPLVPPVLGPRRPFQRNHYAWQQPPPPANPPPAVAAPAAAAAAPPDEELLEIPAPSSLNISRLVAATPNQRKIILRSWLFPQINDSNPGREDEILEVLLDMDCSDLILMWEDKEIRQVLVTQAVRLLDSHRYSYMVQ